MRKHIINAVSGIVIGGFFLFITLRNKPLDDIFDLLRTARASWIILGLVFLVIMFFFRAYRWKLLMENNGNSPGIRNVSYSLLLGFFINSFTPKLGEVIRCTSLKKSSDIPVSNSFGTVVSERIYDLLVLVLAVVLILVIESGRLGNLVKEAFSSLKTSVSGNLLNLFLAFLGLALFIYTLVRIFKRYHIMTKIRDFLRELWTTVKKTFRIRSYRTFIFQTFMIWFLMGLVNYCCLRSLPSTENLNMYFAFVVLFVGTIGWAIPSPGGIGTSHFFVLQLFLLFNMTEQTGVAYGILINGITVLFTIFGGLLAIILVNSFKLVRQEVKSE